MPFYVFARFEPVEGKEAELLARLRRVVGPTRMEPGCLRIHIYESTREPVTWMIHSEWVDEAAFEEHARMPHTVEFLNTVTALMRNPFQALRTRQLP